MSTTQDIEGESESLKQLRRALFYESQFRNAILSDAVSFYDANITKDSIENEFFFRDEENDFISIPDFIGFSTPCKFSDFIERWCYAMVPDMSQKALRDMPNLRQTLLKVFEEGKREYVLNYWGESVSGKKVYFNHRFLLTKNELDEVCALSIIKDYTQIHAIDDEYMQSELELFAYRDPITQGYNYIKFKEKLKEDGQPGSIICLDIHSFKIINSICGVTKGDEVIKYIWDALLISLDMDKGDLAAHINADHFIIFLPTTDKDVIVHKLKNISLSLLVISVDLDIPQLQPYFGVSRWAAGKKIEMAYSEAITAKHNAKQQQNVDYAFFDEEDTNRLIREKEMLDSFEEALARKEFKVWFQPKFTPKTKKLVGAEALVRWVKPDGTMISPGEFIPLFERNNIIRKLDEYIFRNVCYYQKKWAESGKTIVPVSVNLSRASLYYKGVTEEYKRITEIIGVDSRMLPIEITESATITNDAVKKIIDDFHRLGFSLQMDDFGSGYSSLASLNLLHFDTLKLDKSLIDFIGEFGGNRLIEHTISLAKELGINITAEGVETETQVKFLKNIGCDNIQGFFYSKPVPSEDFEKVLDSAVVNENLKTRNDLVEEHIYTFNQNYYKPALYTFIVNLTKDLIMNHTEQENWKEETNILTKSYSQAVNQVTERFISKKSVSAFKKFMDRDNNLKSFSGTQETKILEFQRFFDGRDVDMRIVSHLFKVPDSDHVWLYVKVFCTEPLKLIKN